MSVQQQKDYQPLTSSIIRNPFIELQYQAATRALIHDKSLKTSKSGILALLDSDFFDKEYRIIETAGWSKETFQKTVKRIINCGIACSTMATPLNPQRRNNMCKERACGTCGPYNSVIRLNYPEDIIRYAMFEDRNTAIHYLREIQTLRDHQGWDWLSIVVTPFWDGRYMLRINNIRIADMNPLIDDNQVKESVEILDLEYGFDKVTDITTNNDRVKLYITGSNVQFSTTDLYQAVEHGRDGARELGDHGVKIFNDEDDIVIITKAEYKKKLEDEEAKRDGIIKRKSMRAVHLDDVSEEDAKKTLLEACKARSEHPTKMVIGVVDHIGMIEATQEIMEDWYTNLKDSGYVQPDIYGTVKITQAMYDKFESTLQVEVMELPDNIDTVKFTPDDLSFSGKRLRDYSKVVRNNICKRIQDKLKTAMTIDEVVKDVIDYFYNRRR